MKDEIKLKDMTDFLENVYKDIKEQPTLEEEQKQEKEFINKIKGNNTNEIKEIIEALKPHSDIVKEYPLTLSIEEQKILLDYITNLQEEKENAVECLKYYEEKHFIKPAVDNTKLTIELYNAYLKEINNLQQRIDNAVEYIEENTTKEYEVPLIDSFSISYQKLVDILRGDE